MEKDTSAACGRSGIKQNSSLLDHQCHGCKRTGKEFCQDCRGTGAWRAVAIAAANR